MQEQRKLWKEVEQLQETLHETVSRKGVNSPEAKRAIEAFRNKLEEYNDSAKP